MPRYIDADLFKQCVQENITRYFTCGTGGYCLAEDVVEDIDAFPTADVVPKSENTIELPCVAYNKKHERYQVIHKGKQGHIFASKLYRNRREAEDALAELKKKYTETECTSCAHFVGCETACGGRICDEYKEKKDET